MHAALALEEQQIAQGSPEWHAWRGRGIGGSEVAAIMGESEYDTAYSLALVRIGRKPPKERNAAMDYGLEREAKVRALYELQTGHDCPPALFQHPDLTWARVSLDGWVEELKRVVEIKCMGREKHEQQPEHDAADAEIMDVEIGEPLGMRGKDEPRGEEIEAGERRDRHQGRSRHRNIGAHRPRRRPEGQQVEHHEDREQRGQPAERKWLPPILGRETRFERAPEPAQQFDHRKAEEQAVEREDEIEIVQAAAFHSCGRIAR